MKIYQQVINWEDWAKIVIKMSQKKEMHCAFVPAFPAPGWDSLAAVPETSGQLQAAVLGASKHKERSSALETDARRLDREGAKEQAAELMHRALLLAQAAFPDLMQEVTHTQHYRRNQAFCNVLACEASMRLKRGQIAQGERLLNVLNFACSTQAQLQTPDFPSILRKAALL